MYEALRITGLIAKRTRKRGSGEVIGNFQQPGLASPKRKAVRSAPKTDRTVPNAIGWRIAALSSPGQIRNTYAELHKRRPSTWNVGSDSTSVGWRRLLS